MKYTKIAFDSLARNLQHTEIFVAKCSDAVGEF